MRLLLVNDDGIDSGGILRLAELCVQLGETWVVAPDRQRSAVSQSVTIRGGIVLQRYEFPVSGVCRAFTCSGTPADCTDAACRVLMDSEPDVIFSGINNGFNAGYDIVYSGTVGAAMEGLMLGIPAIVFSHEASDDFSVTDRYLRTVTEKILSGPVYRDRIWNVNFPECGDAFCRGVQWDRMPAGAGYYQTAFRTAAAKDPVAGRPEQDPGQLEEFPDRIELTGAGLRTDPANFSEGTDLRALSDGYVSVGTIRCAALLKR
jgi:5'-nucleotidase